MGVRFVLALTLPVSVNNDQHLCDFLLYHDHNPRKALELAAEATMAVRHTRAWHATRLLVGLVELILGGLLCVRAAPPPQADFKDWWWKARLGKCYYQLGLYRDAERQFKSANKEQTMVVTTLELCKVQQLHTLVTLELPGASQGANQCHCCLLLPGVH